MVCFCEEHLPLILRREVELQQLRGRLGKELLTVEGQNAVVVLGSEVCVRIQKGLGPFLTTQFNIFRRISTV